MQVGSLKAADHNGLQEIIRPCRGMQAGLNNLASGSRSKTTKLDRVRARGKPVQFPLSQEIPMSIPAQFPCDETIGAQKR
jgi:hypothetical protein